MEGADAPAGPPWKFFRREGCNRPMKETRAKQFWWRTGQCLLGGIGLAVLTFAAFRVGALPGEAGLLYSFFIVLIALWAGFVPSIFISVLAMLCFDYFFTPPLFTLDFTLSERRDPIALVTFLGTAFIVSRLMTGIRRRNSALIETNEQLRAEIVRGTEAEEKVRQSEAELRQLIDVIPHQVFVFNSDWTPRFANRRELEYTGLTPEEAQSKDAVARVFDPEDLQKVKLLRERASSERDSIEMEARIRGKDGQYRWFLIRDNPLLDEQGRVLRWYGTRTNIEDRKRAEEAYAKAQAELAHVTRVMTMGELAASIAHEVNQPLSGVVINGNTCLRWLAANPPNLDEARGAANRIVRDGKRAGDVIARIRALATKSGSTSERLNINESVQEVIGLARDEVRRKGVKLKTQLADQLPDVMGDRVQLQQVLLNLMMNAVDAMSMVEDRARELVIKTQADEEGQVQVSVRDSGIGLDEAGREKIFTPFYSTKAAGMGMGLSISRSIIQNHGGRLWAEPNEGPGTSFHFTVPRFQ
jgi:PAS domain S-box-containing protein